MPYTPQRTVRRLLSEARQALGLRLNREVFAALTPAVARVAAARSDVAPLMLSPYKDSSWGLYWLGPGCRERWRPIPVAQLTDVAALLAVVEAADPAPVTTAL